MISRNTQDTQMNVKVINSETMEAVYYCGLTIDRALVCAMEQARGNNNPHKYRPTSSYDIKSARYGKVLGNFWATVEK